MSKEKSKPIYISVSKSLEIKLNDLDDISNQLNSLMKTSKKLKTEIKEQLIKKLSKYDEDVEAILLTKNKKPIGKFTKYYKTILDISAIKELINTEKFSKVQLSYLLTTTNSKEIANGTETD
jgi:hypothetical protein